LFIVAFVIVVIYVLIVMYTSTRLIDIWTDYKPKRKDLALSVIAFIAVLLPGALIIAFNQ
jgi:hypothetical protein